ncbi:MAG: ribose-phosphate pyrophosphokinase [Clostridia bacterium]|jgi:ribose-phosphate pyrophosphokinase|nr:ribose-phosphate pyrophosphokinase [Clostridia bacterium]
MSSFKKKIKLFTGNAHPRLAEEISDYLGIPLGCAQIQRFKDGEISIAINESVRGADVYVIQPTCSPANEHLMELLIMIDALKRASAQRITAVIPYYGYARQERKVKARDPISAKLVANLITAAGANRVIAMDLHANAIQGFFDIPFDHLIGVPILAEHFKKMKLENFIVVSPDIGGVTRARDLAERLGSEIAIIDKRRPAPNQAEVMNIIGKVKGKNVIMTDDIVDTAGTICGGAAALLERGAEKVYACCTHPVLSPPALERIENAPFEEFVVTNTIPIKDENLPKKLKVLSIAPLLGEAMIRIHEHLSVSKLFD